MLSVVMFFCFDGFLYYAMYGGDNLVKMNSSSTRSITANNSTISFVTIIPHGKKASFLMGTTDEELKNQPSVNDGDYNTDDEQPAHSVTLTVSFEIGKYEITNEQFYKVMNWAIDKHYAKISDGDLKGRDDRLYLGITHLNANIPLFKIQYGIEIDGSFIRVKEGSNHHPVHAVTWIGAIAFCNFLSEMEGLSPVYDLNTFSWDTTKNGFRLPTEAEWEYAARKNTRYTYAWGNEINTRYLNYGPSQSWQPNKSVFKPVGYYDGGIKNNIKTEDNSSPFGIYDMAGNVWEWCWDWYGREYYRHSLQENPKGPEKGATRPPYDDRPTKVWRGCGYAYSRIAKRWSMALDKAINEVGFRIARSLF